MTVNREEIVHGLRGLGLASGDVVLMHSSLSSLGQVDGGAQTVIEALLEVLGPEGTLLMPSFQGGGEHDLLRRGCVFDLRTSPSELGLITETFRLLPNVIRSISPTHCTAGCGKRAAEILDGHQYCNVSVGHGSPYEKLVRAEGKILLLGVTHASNTTLHLVENTHGAPTICREKFNPLVIDAGGRCWTVPMHSHMPGLKRRYPRVEDELVGAGIQKNGLVGQATCRLVQAGPMAQAIGRRIRENPLYLCEVFTP